MGEKKKSGPEGVGLDLVCLLSGGRRSTVERPPSAPPFGARAHPPARPAQHGPPPTLAPTAPSSPVGSPQRRILLGDRSAGRPTFARLARSITSLRASRRWMYALASTRDCFLTPSATPPTRACRRALIITSAAPSARPGDAGIWGSTRRMGISGILIPLGRPGPGPAQIASA